VFQKHLTCQEMENSYLQKLAQIGYSIIPCNEQKVPIGAWKHLQTFARTQDEVAQLNAPLYGLVTGVNDVEVVDVDLKVFSSLKEQQEFWEEYVGFLKDNIDDFEKKFVIKKTKNKGYHILYRCKKIQGNTKIAKLEGHRECVIESRGQGGMVILYDDTISDKDYQHMEYISEEDREILWSCSRTYDYNEPEVRHEPKEHVSSEHKILSFDDFNQKTSIFDVIGDDFKIVANLSKHYVIKRHGAESPHSGYVYKDTDKMYLFSTATIYPNEKILSAADAYAWKYHGGNLKDASRDLYNKGFGSRSKKIIEEKQKEIPKPEEVLSEYKINKEDLEFPIDIFPEPIQTYILECNRKLDSNIDFMGVSLMWVISVMVGNTVQIEVKKGWKENGTLWISVVGRAGLGKTPSINNIIFPLEKINSREIKRYLKEREEYDFYESLSKKDKDDYPEVKKPKKTQFIANDITIEALVDLHQDSDVSVGVFKDELAGWLKDMNKYREGSDLEFWLSSWSGKSVNLNRLTRPGSFVERPYIPVLGGIQPGIFNSFYTEENKDNGFMDRMLLSYPDATVDYYNENELSADIIEWYREIIIYIYDNLKSLVERDEDHVIEPQIATMEDGAKEEWKRIFNTITDNQNDDEENEYLKSMYPKQKSYIPRFALLINIFNSYFDDNLFALHVSRESMLKAEKLSNYFIANAKKIKVDSIEKNDIKVTIKKAETNADKIKALFLKDPNFNKNKLAELIGVSVQYVRKVTKQLENETK
jgi:hypothetical protein